MDDLSRRYNCLAGAEHRRSFGQFFTPLDVAAFMCRWTLADNASDLYDPAFGLGSFYFAAKSVQPSISFAGTEVDEKILEYFRAHAQDTSALSLNCGNYLAQWGQRRQAIVCNPPYMRFQHFTGRSEVFAAFEQQLQTRLSGYTNIASAFLIKSLSELAHGGRLAYIMPLEFLNTGYGAIVKERLLSHGLLKVLIKLKPEKDVFPDVTTSVGVILASNDGHVSPVRFYSVSSLGDLSDVLSTAPVREVDVASLKPSEKWMKYFENGRSSFFSPDLVPIDSYGGFSRGIATGANEFFAISPSKATALGIPPTCLLDCITRSAQIKSSVFCNADFDALKRTDANVLLLNVNDQPAEPVREYLRYGEKKGYHLRYLTKMRSPWHKLERRTPAPLLFGVFSREKFKVIRNLSSAVNLTCYHCFYPNLFGQELCDALFLYFQSRAARQILGINMRHYGDGLEKFEPNDLNRALAPSASWFSRLLVDQINEAMEYCRVNNTLPEEIDKIFDHLMLNAEPEIFASKRTAHAGKRVFVLPPGGTVMSP